MKGPTTEQLEAAENYALGQMCLSIPAKYGNGGYTTWDPKTQRCLLTEQGCQPGETNMLSQWPLDGTGNIIDFTMQTSSRYYDVWKYAPPDLYVMKATPKSDGRAVCSRGSARVYQWCQVPPSRLNGDYEGGITDTVPFKYGVQNGHETCLLPEAYCKEHAYDWNQRTLQCEEPVGLQVADFFGIKGVVQHAIVDGPFSLKSSIGGQLISMAMDEQPDQKYLAFKPSDSRLKENIRIHTRDFVAPGIHLYTFRWKPWALEIYGKHGNDIGFIADTLPTEWVTVDGHGYRNINLDVKHPGMKKIHEFYRRVK